MLLTQIKGGNSAGLVVDEQRLKNGEKNERAVSTIDVPSV
jgi:hypothetical protein